MRLHNPAITGSLTVSGSSNVDFTSATGGVSGSFRASDIKSAIPANTVSGSAQLSTAISGSFTEASSSFSIRIARNEGTGSSLTSDSGSFSTRVTRNEASASALTSDSGSFSTRITRNEASASALTTDSGSFSTRVSNLKTDSGSFSTRVSNLKSDSGSFSTRITAATSSISAIKTDSGSFSTRITTNTLSGSILAGSGNIQGLGSTNNVTFSSVTATGNITAQEFHTEFVSSSIIHTSGSTKFGDTADDIHQMTGSLQLSGSVGNESYIIGTNVGIGTTNPAATLHVKGNTAIRLESAGETSTAGFDLSNDSDHDLYIKAADTGADVIVGYGGADVRMFGNTTERMVVKQDGKVGIGNTAPPKELTVQGDISASGDLTVASELFITNRGSAGTPAIRFGGDGSSGIYSGGSAEFGYAHGGSQKFLVDSSGNGTFAGNVTLDNGNANGANLALASSGNTTWEMDNASGGFRLFRTGGSVGLALDTSYNATFVGSIESTGANAKISGSSSSTGSFGMVGVGTANPETKLHVGGANQGGLGSAFMARGDSGDIARIWSGATGGSRALMVGHLQSNASSQAIFEVKRGNTSTDAFYNEMFVVKTDLSYFNNGNVGIGNSAPPQALTVEGNVSGSGTGSFGVLKTGDIELENERGHWRIIEEEEYLSIYNVKSNKKFKFVLEEIE